MAKYRVVASSGNLSRRRFLIALGASPLLFLLPHISYATTSIHELEGEIFINNRRATIDSRIRLGDQIVVSHNSRLVFSMGGDAFLLRGGTALQVAGRGVASSLRLLTGALLAVFDKRSKPTHIFTNVATIGIRGTAVYARAEPHHLYTCTCYGKTDLRIGKHVDRIEASHHNAHEVTPDSTGNMVMQSMAILDHTDDELRMLEAYVGRKPAFDM